MGNDSMLVCLGDSELGDSGERWHQTMQDFVEHVASLNFIISAVGGIMVFSKQSERRLGICYLFIASLLWYELHTIKMYSFQMFSLMSAKNKYILIHSRMYLCNN